jgi:Xaa-Pro aminopeptidase
MAGANSAQAGAAYALSRPYAVSQNDPVLVHCNSHADGYWTDITRTYCLGEPDRQLRTIYDAVFSARAAGLSAIKPGVTASAVDRAARELLGARGLENTFNHSTGHGVGFTGIDPNALPRLHPKSPDVLETGMVFNLEPAVYLEDVGGVRHCDMLLVTEQGYELLTPFQTTMRELAISGPEKQAA